MHIGTMSWGHIAVQPPWMTAIGIRIHRCRGHIGRRIAVYPAISRRSVTYVSCFCCKEKYIQETHALELWVPYHATHHTSYYIMQTTEQLLVIFGHSGPLQLLIDIYIWGINKPSLAHFALPIAFWPNIVTSFNAKSTIFIEPKNKNKEFFIARVFQFGWFSRLEVDG